MLAVVRIRGRVNLSEEITRTLGYLHLKKSNHCVIIPDNIYSRGMLQKVKDYVTWGPLDKAGLDAISPRIELEGDKAPATKSPNSKSPATKSPDFKLLLTDKTLKDLNARPTIRLHPPRKGFKSVTHPYPDGDLGNRGAEINKLLQRMR